MANYPYVVAGQREGIPLILIDSISHPVPLSPNLNLSDAIQTPCGLRATLAEFLVRKQLLDLHRPPWRWIDDVWYMIGGEAAHST